MQTDTESIQGGGTGREFAGGVFHGSLEGGRSGATLTLTGSAVLATTPEGQRFGVPYSEVELSLGGASGKMWFCRSRDRETTIFCEDRRFGQALREAGQRDLVERLDAIEHQRSHASRRYATLLLGGALALAALVGGGILFARSGLGLALRALPISA
ncbi:MAG TPA: hypothetical protein VFZ61_14160, partial [Polyangiales bacterium]